MIYWMNAHPEIFSAITRINLGSGRSWRSNSFGDIRVSHRDIKPENILKGSHDSPSEVCVFDEGEHHT